MTRHGEADGARLFRRLSARILVAALVSLPASFPQPLLAACGLSRTFDAGLNQVIMPGKTD